MTRSPAPHRSATLSIAAALMVLLYGAPASAQSSGPSPALTPAQARAEAELARAEMARGLVVTMDQARIVRLPPRVTTIVIGNPLIADATVQPGGVVVLTGKGIGSTNLIALDRTGEQLAATTLTVRPQTANVVRVFRGTDRETYACNPTCERTIAIGDVGPFFEGALSQSGSRAAASGGQQAAPR